MMNPREYFPSIYFQDLFLFEDGNRKNLPLNGPTGMLCLLTLSSRMFQPEKWVYYREPADFLCCQFVLNLVYRWLKNINFSYCDEWCCRTEPFLKMDSCSDGHGGFDLEPLRMINFANSFIIKFLHHLDNEGKELIPIEKRDEVNIFSLQLISATMLRDYSEFYIHDYLPSLDISEQVIRALKKKIKQNTSYFDFKQLLHPL